MKLHAMVGLGTSLVMLGGCAVLGGEDEFDDEKASTAVAALDVGTSSSEIAEIASTDPVKAAAGLAASTTKGCRTKTVDPANPRVVHVTLNACGGRFDRHVVTGSLVVTFSDNADGSLHSETESANLLVDGRPFTRKVSADVRIDGAMRHVSRHAEKTGTKKNGDSLVRTSDEIVVIDTTTRCRTVNGTGHAIVGGNRRIETTITNLETCETPEGEELCPKGSIEHVNQAKGKTVLETFDGSATVEIDVARRKGSESRTWTLACTPRG